jgi:ABC-type uncharacterized transport system auxiliary subunit
VKRGLLVLISAAISAALSGCISVGIGSDTPPQLHLLLHDNGSAVQRRAEPLVPAILIQALPADATADTVSIAYSNRPHEFAYYQLASWTERPVRQVPRLLQQRLEARGLADAVGMLGDPLRADWQLTVAIDTLHHDVSAAPGQGRVALTVELFDRRTRMRIARRTFTMAQPAASADAQAAAGAMSQSLTQVFDALLPWLEAELQRARPKPAQ